MSFTFSEKDAASLVVDNKKADSVFDNALAGRSGIPVAFMGEGTYSLRVWPDRDSNGRLRLYKRTQIHNFRFGDNKRLRVIHDDRINDLASHAQKSGVDDAWKWRSWIKVYMMAHVFEVRPESKWLKSGSDVCFILDIRQAKALSSFISRLSKQELVENLNPTNSGHPIHVVVNGRGKNQRVNFALDRSENLHIPPMTQSWNGLDDVYVRDGDVISDEDFAEFRQHVQDRIAELDDGRIEDGPTPSFSPPAPSSPSSSPAPAPVAVDESERCEIRKAAVSDPALAAEYPNAAFGRKPNGMVTHCLLCPHEDKCQQETSTSVPY